ncbi:MAG: glycosyltransferase [Solirubrobacteraceae bacterium]
MSRLQHIPVGAIDPRRFDEVVTPAADRALIRLIERDAPTLEGRVIWNVNSTAKGGGVVELLRPLLGYSRGAGVDGRWVVISGNAGFFEFTKRLHNNLHGVDGDGGTPTDEERRTYERTLAGNAEELAPLVHPQDIVILHDPQTAGLVPAIKQTGAIVIWRCHVGLDHPNRRSREAWAFLLRYVTQADACVYSRAAFVWDGLDPAKITLIQPSIDPFSPKNADQTFEQVRAILARSGIATSGPAEEATFIRSDGSPGRVDRTAEMFQCQPLRLGDRLVTQVSRWDRLKDPLGVLMGFTDHVLPRSGVHLLLAGPATAAVADDPEGGAVFRSVLEAWEALPQPTRGHVHLAALPMDDTDENAAIVNAIQRHSDIVVQKSLAEGFGLTVAEAMWKERAVVASRVGGIQDQIVNGRSGLLIKDAENLAEFGAAVVRLLDDPERARRIGTAARIRVRDHFLGPQHLGRYFELIQRLAQQREANRSPGPLGRKPHIDPRAVRMPAGPERPTVRGTKPRSSRSRV